MANISFNKLGLKINTEINTINWNGQEIEVAQYLPIQEKLLLMQTVIEQSMTQYNYANPVQVEVYTYLNILKSYTNIKFTDKQLEDPAKLYDLVKSSGLLKMVLDAIPLSEITELLTGADKSIESFYKYRTSVLGILDVLKSDYSNLNLDINKLMQEIKDPEALGVLKQIAPIFTSQG